MDSRKPRDPARVPKYHASRTVEEWRAYHREYYRKNAEKRRKQAANYHQRRQRRLFNQALMLYSGSVPKRIIRMLFER